MNESIVSPNPPPTRRRGVYARGADHWRAKLTEADVRAIRSRYSALEVSQPKLAVEFGVSLLTISNVIHRKTWAHLI